MTAISARAWHIARALVGTPYRLHGRCTAHGLDCVGLVALAYRDAGLRFDAPPADYRLRHAAVAALAGALAAAGFVPVATGVICPGDIIIQQWPTRALHMAIATPGAAVHAHVGLRRVVETPGQVDHVVALWRLRGDCRREPTIWPH